MIDHAQIAGISVAWLQRPIGRLGPGCTFAVNEAGASEPGERGDAFGVRSVAGDCCSVLVEAKVSRGDFLRDASKAHRVQPCTGIGTFRYFAAPVGLIGLDELPDRWGLIEVDQFGHVHVRAGHVLVARGEQGVWRHEVNLRREWLLLAALLARVGRVDQFHGEMRRARRTIAQLSTRCEALESQVRGGTDLLTGGRSAVAMRKGESRGQWEQRVLQAEQSRASVEVPSERHASMTVDTLRVWLVDDCDYVAARTLESASEWYDLEVGAPLGGPRKFKEISTTASIRLDPSPDGVDATMADRIRLLHRAGVAFPAIIAGDGPY
ncbi:hypothetical protein [Duganella vulcania]|uniref:Uncharacterized protein n=1 Tax=Duganella vulcania TaxID=2692166 RepID=A0A845GH82_9BURK|nr:hypothetical protein [Duganella vulcania]MYM92368.1 hypothetical protein [Duganella vulcania]